MRRLQLFIVRYGDRHERESFERVAALVNQRAPDVRAEVIRDSRHRHRRWKMARLPSMYFCPVPVSRVRPLRGRLFQGRKLDKTAELAVLERAGVPVPRWQRLRPDVPPDLDGYGPYVVMKPERGGAGAYVKLVRRGRARWRPPSRRGEYFVQEFVYTGPWASSYRVSVLFGEVLNCYRLEASRDRVPYTPENHRRGNAGGVASIVSNERHGTCRLSREADVMRLARRAARSLPDHPLLGVDVVRHHDDGRLFVLEVNTGGWTWQLGSPSGRSIQEENGIDFESQFGGVAWAAEILTAATRRHAR